MGCGLSTSFLPNYLGGGGVGGGGPSIPLPDRNKVDRVAAHDSSTSPTKQLLKDNNNTVESIVSDSSHGQKSLSTPVNNMKVDGEQQQQQHDIKNKKEDMTKGDKEYENEARTFDIGNPLWIGSPSFRDYCIIPRDSKIDDGDREGENKETKTQEGLSHASPKPNEGLIESNDKGGKGRRFRKVFPVGRSSAMKTILNVTTCYNPNHSASRIALEN